MQDTMSFDFARRDLIKVYPRNFDIKSSINYLNPIEDLTIRRISYRAYLRLEIDFSRDNINICTLGDLCKFSYAEILRRLKGSEASANSILVLINTFGLTLEGQVASIVENEDSEQVPGKIEHEL